MPTAPSVLPWSSYYLGLDRILVNVAQQGDEIIRVVDRLTAEPVVKQGAETLMPLVIVADIGNADAFHHCADVLGALGNKQMDVIIHQAIGVDVAIRGQWLAVAVLRSRDRTKNFEELAAVLIVGKNVTTVNATQHYVVNTGIAMLSALTWHGQRMIVWQR